MFSNILHTHTPGANPAVEEAALIHHENSSLCLHAPELAVCRLVANLEGLFCPPFSPTDEPVTGRKDAEASCPRTPYRDAKKEKTEKEKKHQRLQHCGSP